MTMPDKDLQVIQHILRYCHTISVDIPPLTDYCMRILQAADVDCPASEPIQKNHNRPEV